MQVEEARECFGLLFRPYKTSMRQHFMASNNKILQFSNTSFSNSHFILNAFRYPDVHIAIYTGDLDADPEKILSRTEKTFNVKLRPNIEFIYLHGRKWVEASTYPYFTLLGQSLGSICLGIEALNNLTPGDVIDALVLFHSFY